MPSVFPAAPSTRFIQVVVCDPTETEEGHDGERETT